MRRSSSRPAKEAQETGDRSPVPRSTGEKSRRQAGKYRASVARCQQQYQQQQRAQTNQDPTRPSRAVKTRARALAHRESHSQIASSTHARVRTPHARIPQAHTHTNRNTHKTHTHADIQTGAQHSAYSTALAHRTIARRKPVADTDITQADPVIADITDNGDSGLFF